jgi:hypothetical protein
MLGYVLPMAFVFLGIFSLVTFLVGLRFFMRGISTGARPELLLGTHTLLISAGNIIVQAGVIFHLQTSVWGDIIIRTGGTLIDSGYLTFAFFCVDVYHPELPRLKWLWTGIFVFIIASQIISVLLHLSLDPAFACQQLLRLPSYSWGTYEAFRFYRIMRRRSLYGMGDPLVENRFLLWGLATGLALLILIALSITFRLTPAHWLGHLMLEVAAILAIPAAIVAWVSFFPPDWYRARLEKQLESEGA